MLFLPSLDIAFTRVMKISSLIFGSRTKTERLIMSSDVLNKASKNSSAESFARASEASFIFCLILLVSLSTASLRSSSIFKFFISASSSSKTFFCRANVMTEAHRMLMKVRSVMQLYLVYSPDCSWINCQQAASAALVLFDATISANEVSLFWSNPVCSSRIGNCPR